MRGRMSRRANNPALPTRSNGADPTRDHRAGELHEIAAIVSRAARLGIDPERVLVALGLDPMSADATSLFAGERQGPRRGRPDGVSADV